MLGIQKKSGREDGALPKGALGGSILLNSECN